MRPIFLLCLLLGLFSVRSTRSMELTEKQREDPNVHLTDDSVVIEAVSLLRHRRAAGPQGSGGAGARPPLPHAPCFTAGGQLGRCASFRECYPYFKAAELPAWGPWLFGSRDTCSYYNDQIRQPDVFQTLGVCCVSPVITDGGGLSGPPPVAPVEAPPGARPSYVLGSWPPPLPTHPPNHTPATHPPGLGLPTIDYNPTSTTKKPLSTTWGTKPTLFTTAKPLPWPPSRPTSPAAVTTTAAAHADSLYHSCGSKNGYQDQERIVGGHNAEPNEWPWIAALFNAGRQFCGGSLIDSEHILTAAHCVAHMTSWDVARVTVRLGDHDIKVNHEIQHIEKKLKRVVRHRGFDMRTLYNDIAVLTLDSPVQFSKQVRPVCLPIAKGLYTGKNGVVIGWGSLRESGPQPAVLQEVSIPIWSNTECRSKYGSAAPGGIVEHMLCAGQATRDSCSGDSGGPLMVSEDGRWNQVGVVSWGIGCGKGQYPGVYSRVTSFMPWIQKNSV